jgi:3-isopropylmalate/(R)-2-methylmalate dehydratase large subunit
MTVCNMSIEAGARAGMIAPDDTTFAYPRGPRPRAQGGRLGGRPGRVASLPTDPGATFDKEVPSMPPRWPLM